MRNFVITVNGKTYEVGVEEVGAVASAPVVTTVKAAPAATPVAAPVSAPAPAAPKAAAPANGEKVLSPFPGLIKNLLVAEGASVKKDQPILVLEAMKMDNDITAPCDGVVSFQVVKGANVESDAVLAVIG
ncbi:MAG: acetyl-CoA carboxylase biotin carboxyl carrier protein subunit [Clostridiales bacterium]|nr:acetyl-CoA carboxylase biotin carboxyl carrier protein subunit [Clostridiales bacterium]